MENAKAKDLLEKTEDYLIREGSGYMEQIGVKTTLGRIFGLLMTQSDPMSLKEISDRLQLSKPAVSTSIKSGLYVQLFRKVHNPDYPREDFYEMGIDFMEVMIDPGLTKLSILREQFVKAKEMIDDSGIDVSADPELEKLSHRLDFLVEAFRIVLDEYKRFGDSVKEKLKQLRSDSDA